MEFAAIGVETEVRQPAPAGYGQTILPACRWADSRLGDRGVRKEPLETVSRSEAKSGSSC